MAYRSGWHDAGAGDGDRWMLTSPDGIGDSPAPGSAVRPADGSGASRRAGGVAERQDQAGTGSRGMGAPGAQRPKDAGCFARGEREAPLRRGPRPAGGAGPTLAGAGHCSRRAVGSEWLSPVPPRTLRYRMDPGRSVVPLRAALPHPVPNIPLGGDVQSLGRRCRRLDGASRRRPRADSGGRLQPRGGDRTQPRRRGRSTDGHPGSEGEGGSQLRCAVGSLSARGAGHRRAGASDAAPSPAGRGLPGGQRAVRLPRRPHSARTSAA